MQATRVILDALGPTLKKVKKKKVKLILITLIKTLIKVLFN